MSNRQAIIGLIKPKSPTNVGAIMRAAGCFQASAVLYTGSRYDRAAKFNTDKRKQNLDIPLTGVENLMNEAPDKAKIICVELVVGAVPLNTFAHPENAFYIFGPEDGTISQDILDQADSVVYVPTTGCLNLAATVNVVLYDRLIKSTDITLGNDLIRQSRDTNNSTEI